MTKMVDLVIRIPEETYKSIIKSDIEVEFYRSADVFYIPISIMCAIRTGKVLPKGHGRLIDADAVLEDPYGFTYKDIDIAETIIEADNEGE